MTIETKDKYFKEVVSILKSFGFYVWTHENIFNDNFRYGWVTDGVHMLYFQIDDLEGLKWSTECIPSKETGSGCRVHISYPLEKEKIENAFKVKHGTPYRDFEHFKRRYWCKLIEL